MYDPKKHAELNQRIDDAVKKFEETRAKADQLVTSKGPDAPETQQAVFVDAVKAAKAASQAADELVAYLTSAGAK